MQVPPKQPQSFKPPPGYRPPPKPGHIPIWACILIGVAILVPLLFSGWRAMSRSEADNLATDPNEPLTNSTPTNSYALPDGWSLATADNISIGVPPSWKTRSIANKSSKIFLVHVPADKDTGYASNVSLMALHVGPTTKRSLPSFTEGMRRTFARKAIGNVDVQPIIVAGSDGEVIQSEMQAKTSDGAILVESRVFITIRKETAYVIATAIPKTLDDRLWPEVQQMLQTLMIDNLGSPAVPQGLSKP